MWQYGYSLQVCLVYGTAFTAQLQFVPAAEEAQGRGASPLGVSAGQQTSVTIVEPTNGLRGAGSCYRLVASEDLLTQGFGLAQLVAMVSRCIGSTAGTSTTYKCGQVSTLDWGLPPHSRVPAHPLLSKYYLRVFYIEHGSMTSSKPARTSVRPLDSRQHALAILKRASAFNAAHVAYRT